MFYLIYLVDVLFIRNSAFLFRRSGLIFLSPSITSFLLYHHHHPPHPPHPHPYSAYHYNSNNNVDYLFRWFIRLVFYLLLLLCLLRLLLLPPLPDTLEISENNLTEMYIFFSSPPPTFIVAAGCWMDDRVLPTRTTRSLRRTCRWTMNVRLSAGKRKGWPWPNSRRLE